MEFPSRIPSGIPSGIPCGIPYGIPHGVVPKIGTTIATINWHNIQIVLIIPVQSDCCANLWWQLEAFRHLPGPRDPRKVQKYTKIKKQKYRKKHIPMYPCLGSRAGVLNRETEYRDPEKQIALFLSLLTALRTGSLARRVGNVYVFNTEGECALSSGEALADLGKRAVGSFSFNLLPDTNLGSSLPQFVVDNSRGEDVSSSGVDFADLTNRARGSFSVSLLSDTNPDISSHNLPANSLHGCWQTVVEFSNQDSAASFLPNTFTDSDLGLWFNSFRRQLVSQGTG